MISVDCRLLATRVLCGMQLALPYLLNVCVQLTSGLQHLHAACGVLHRDLKTDNALVASKDPLLVKWADFGCSVKLLSPSASAASATYGKGEPTPHTTSTFRASLTERV